MTAPLLERLKAGIPALRWADQARVARVVETLPLGPGSRLLVVAFGGRTLLIGQSRAGLVRLADSESPSA
jgi:hypothetical protein